MIGLAALAGATGAIGELIAAELVGEAAELALVGAKEMLKTTVEEGLNKGMEASYEAAQHDAEEHEMDAVTEFIHLQKRALITAADWSEDNLDLGSTFSENYKKHPSDTLDALARLDKALVAQTKQAAEVQYDHTVQAWATVEASSELGRKQPTPEAEKRGRKRGLICPPSRSSRGRMVSCS